MGTPNIPNWTPSPVPVDIVYKELREGATSEEMVVQFAVNGDEFTTFVHRSAVDESAGTLKAMIIADMNDSWLIDLPAETLTSGPRIRVPKSAEGKVFRRKPKQ